MKETILFRAFSTGGDTPSWVFIGLIFAAFFVARIVFAVQDKRGK
jgi:hypothetical protein